MGSLSQALATRNGDRWGRLSHIDQASPRHRVPGLKAGRVPVPNTPRRRTAIKRRKAVQGMIVAYAANDRATFAKHAQEFCRLGRKLDEGEVIPSLHFLFLRFPDWCPRPDWDEFGTAISDRATRKSFFGKLVQSFWNF